MKGILFTEILFNKTIRKEKTMTRRAPASLKVINESPDDWDLVRNVFTWSGFETPEKSGFTEFGFSQKGGGLMTYVREPETIVKPTYKVGEVVYIKEPYVLYQTIDHIRRPDGRSFSEVSDGCIAYKYDGFDTVEDVKDYIAMMGDKGLEHVFTDQEKWRNKLFMGADKARYYIRITNVKCERLYDITDEDCLKEGIDVDKAPYREDFFYDYQNNDYSFIMPRYSFFSLFRFANKVPKSKEIPNMWVFCYEYVLCDINGNKL